MSKDLTQIERTGYTILDWLSAVGGIQSIVWGIMSSLLAFVNGNYFNDSLIARLYKYESGSSGDSDHGSARRRRHGQAIHDSPPKHRREKLFEVFSFDKIRGCLCYICSHLCCSRLAKRRAKQHEALKKARTAYENETDIVEIVRKIRFLQEAVWPLLG